MPDVLVTVPKSFRFGGKTGLAAWLSEGDRPGAEWSGQDWWFTTYGGIPDIKAGERVYVCCNSRLVGYSPLVDMRVNEDRYFATIGANRAYHGPIAFIRRGGAVACTIDRPIIGFRGWRYRDWERSEEKPINLESA